MKDVWLMAIFKTNLLECFEKGLTFFGRRWWAVLFAEEIVFFLRFHSSISEYFANIVDSTLHGLAHDLT